jgi:spore coat protein U-like protein
MRGDRIPMTFRRAAVMLLAMVCVCTAAEAAQCTVSTSSVNFGTYDVFDTQPNDSTGTITLNCNGGARNVAITISRGSSPSYAYRFMNRVFELLFYNLYQDASRSVIWGDGSGGSQMEIVDNPPNNRNVALTVFARIPPGQDVSAGSYSDTVTVTVQY